MNMIEEHLKSWRGKLAQHQQGLQRAQELVNFHRSEAAAASGAVEALQKLAAELKAAAAPPPAAPEAKG